MSAYPTRQSPLARLFGRRSRLHRGQLDSRDLEALVERIARGLTDDQRERIVIEVGTAGGHGSTVAIHRALSATRTRFRLLGYEGDAGLAERAARHWRRADNVRVVNEYFMHAEDIDRAIRPHVRAEDRAAYLPVFDELAARTNFLSAPPPGPIDLLFIDSVRYTHLAILRAAASWLAPDSVVLMEDDIPGYGELAIIESEIELRDVVRHEIRGHPWPLVQFRIAAA